MLEKLAKQAHDSWSGWMKYLFHKSTKNLDGSVTIPKWAIDRWERQINTPYRNLPIAEKLSDIKEAKEYMSIIYAEIIKSDNMKGEALKYLDKLFDNSGISKATLPNRL